MVCWRGTWRERNLCLGEGRSGFRQLKVRICRWAGFLVARARTGRILGCLAPQLLQMFSLLSALRLCPPSPFPPLSPLSFSRSLLSSVWRAVWRARPCGSSQTFPAHIPVPICAMRGIFVHNHGFPLPLTSLDRQRRAERACAFLGGGLVGLVLRRR